MKPLGMGIGGATSLSAAEIETLKQAEALFATRKYRRCIALLEGPVAAGGAPVAVHRLYAEALYKKKMYRDCLPSFAECLKAWSTDCPFPVFKMTRTAARKILKEPHTEAFWRSCSDTTSVVFERCMRNLLSGDYAAAELLFRQGAAVLFDDPDVRALWEKSFRFLSEALKTNVVSVYGYAPRQVRKIMVSGLGWSGSGALFDYLLEFKEIKGIRGESQYLEGARGVKHILACAGDRSAFVRAVVEYYFFNLLGQAEMQNSSSFKSLQFARKILKSEHALKHSENVACISYLLARCLVSYGDAEALDSALSVLINEVANRLVVGPDFDTGKIALLDNVIHIVNIELATRIDDLDILCTFRDPRSNYVARIGEDSGFEADVAEFIKMLKKRLPILENRLAEVQKTTQNREDTNVHRVQFEEFVLSEPYRKRLAGELGLELSSQKTHTRFKPWESMRNVILHQLHDKPEEIKKIEDALGDYCYEPRVIKMNELG